VKRGGKNNNRDDSIFKLLVSFLTSFPSILSCHPGQQMMVVQYDTSLLPKKTTTKLNRFLYFFISRSSYDD
jgi:hypothetical protein